MMKSTFIGVFRSNGLLDPALFWPDGVVPYVFLPNNFEESIDGGESVSNEPSGKSH